jgi:uroporphyrinogen-III decarboxylase
MTSRERALAALNHREPDRVPVDLGSTVNSSIMATAYARLRERLGVNDTPPKIIDLSLMLAEVELPVLEKLGCDFVGLIPLVRSFGIASKDWKPWQLFDGTKVLVPGPFEYQVEDNGDLLLFPGGDRSAPPSGRMPKDGHYFDAIVRQPEFDWDELDPADIAEQFGRTSDEALEFAAARADLLYRTTDFALVGAVGTGSLGGLPQVVAGELPYPKGIRNFNDWLMAHLIKPDYIKAIFEQQTAQTIENLELYRQAVGDRIVAVFISGTDFGTQRQELISPQLYRDLYLPFHRRMNDWVHEHTAWKTMYHSCGSVYHLMPSFIEAGIDILNPVQCSAAEMEPERLKREFGDQIVFWGGGVDTQKTLPFGTPDEVRQEIAERMRIFAPGGGYVFNTVHNIQAGTPLENILAVFDAARDFGRYPIGGARS